MISLPNLPADNLYKFVAFAGLALTVASAVSLVQVEIALFDRLDVIEDALGKKFDEHIREKGQIPTHTPQGQVSTDPELVAFKTGEIKRSARRAGASMSRARFAETLLSVLFSLGVGISYFGLKWWHVYVQRKSDEILLLQLEQEKLKLAKMQRELTPESSAPAPEVANAPAPARPALEGSNAPASAPPAPKGANAPAPPPGPSVLTQV